jgi:hypothetical protein
MTTKSNGGGDIRPKNQGPDGPNAAKPLKIDMPAEAALRRFMKAPPMLPGERQREARERSTRKGDGK